MTLEDKTLYHSPALTVEIITVGNVCGDDKNGYNIYWGGREQPINMPIHVNPDRLEFIKRLEKGNKLLIVRHGELYLTIYGPLEEDKLYNCGRFL